MEPLIQPTPGHKVYYHQNSSGSVITVWENFAGQISASVGGMGWAGYGEWHLVLNPKTDTYYLRHEWYEMAGADSDVPLSLDAMMKDCVFDYLAHRRDKLDKE